MILARRSSALLSIVAAVAIVTAAPRSAESQAPADVLEPEDFSALAVTMGNVGPAQPTVIEISIRRWPGEEERNQLVTTLVEKGPNALLEAFRKGERVGTIRTLDSVGWDLRYAHQVPLPDGRRRVVVITDRPIGFGEAREQPRTIDYPFTVIEMRIKPDGKGDGTMTIATKVIPVGKTIYLEDYGTQPVQLQNVQARKRKP